MTCVSQVDSVGGTMVALQSSPHLFMIVSMPHAGVHVDLVLHSLRPLDVLSRLDVRSFLRGLYRASLVQPRHVAHPRDKGRFLLTHLKFSP